MDGLGKRFHTEMIGIYTSAKKELNYRFLQLVSAKGGVLATNQLIAKDGGTDGFETLWEHRRLDLSVETLVLRTEYHSLFSQDELDLYRNRLECYGYIVCEQ